MSIIVVVLDSVASLSQKFGSIFNILEWTFTIFFSIEYVLRIVSVRRPAKYIFSFFGIVDLLSIVPTFISVLLPGTEYLLVIRTMRLLRIFRVLKLVKYVGEAQSLVAALHASRRKITVFLFAVLALTIILGSMMYVIEGGENGFTSIPVGIYWAIVTLTTVGYGDISPKTDIGIALASVVMIVGYAIIAIPTGIVTAEIAMRNSSVTTQACPECSKEGHDFDSKHCKYCGALLHDDD
jgi:voltage-gated potassium channel